MLGFHSISEAPISALPSAAAETFADGAMSANGIATAIAVGNSFADGVANAAGIAAAIAVGATDAFSDAVMDAAGSATAQAVGESFVSAVMSAAGLATVIAVGDTALTPGDVIPIWRDSDFAAPGAPTHSFTGVDIGAAAADRLVFVVAGIVSDIPANTGVLSINGTPATREVSQQSGVLSELVEIWWAQVPTGTTATISYDSSGGGDIIDVIWISTYEVTDASLIDPVADADSATASAVSDTITLDIGSGGGWIAGALAGLDSVGGDSVSWVGATEDLDREDLVGGLAYVVFSTASDSSASALPGHDITVTHTGSDLADEVTVGGVVLRSVNALLDVDGVMNGAGSATVVAQGEGATESVMNAAGSATAAAIGEAITVADAAMSAAGSSTAQAEGASLADGAMSADGSATAIAESEGSIASIVPDFTPVGGGGAIPPVRDRDKRFRIRKDKTQPHVIRVGDWPTEAQLRELADALEREERRDFAQFISGLEEPEQAEVYDEEEQALMLILAAA